MKQFQILDLPPCRTEILRRRIVLQRQFLRIYIQDAWGKGSAWYLRYRLNQYAVKLHGMIRELNGISQDNA